MNKKDKLRELEAYFIEKSDHAIMVAFSGGVDSSLLLAAACHAMREAGSKYPVYAVTVHTTLHPMGEVQLCSQVAAELGAVHKMVEIDELGEAGIIDNPIDRCYRCKRYLFTQVKALAKELDCPVIFEGTNADDLGVYRPGIRAVQELGLYSPLAELQLTKEEVRDLAAEYGISVANRPSSPCLATRFPYGTHLTTRKMRMADEGEKYLRSLGLYNVRVRVHEDPRESGGTDAGDQQGLLTARIEVDAGELGHMLQRREAIICKLHELGFSYVTLDLEGFISGSMDKGL